MLLIMLKRLLNHMLARYRKLPQNHAISVVVDGYWSVLVVT
jgi:hypothetical protein